jgi:hypothetical protein
MLSSEIIFTLRKFQKEKTEKYNLLKEIIAENSLNMERNMVI